MGVKKCIMKGQNEHFLLFVSKYKFINVSLVTYNFLSIEKKNVWKMFMNESSKNNEEK